MTEPKAPERRESLETCTLHVCTSCKPAGTKGNMHDGPPGFHLLLQLRSAVAESPLRDRVRVESAECLSLCSRACGIALSSPGAWTYLFGDQQPDRTVDDIVTCASRYLDTRDGFMGRDSRPKALRASILGRVPPSKGT